METIQLIRMQPQHAIHLDVNQSWFCCQNKNTANLSCFLSHKKASIVQINDLSNFLKQKPYKYCIGLLLHQILHSWPL